MKVWRDANPDYFKKHYIAKREHKKRQHREWYAKNSARALQTAREYAVANPDLIRVLGRRSAMSRRARLRDAFIETVDPHTVFERDKGICGICRGSCEPQSDWEIDHVMPLAKGGAHAYDNVQLAHLLCNRAKGAKVLEDRIAC